MPSTRPGATRAARSTVIVPGPQPTSSRSMPGPQRREQVGRGVLAVRQRCDCRTGSACPWVYVSTPAVWTRLPHSGTRSHTVRLRAPRPAPARPPARRARGRRAPGRSGCAGRAGPRRSARPRAGRRTAAPPPSPAARRPPAAGPSACDHRRLGAVPRDQPRRARPPASSAGRGAAPTSGSRAVTERAAPRPSRADDRVHRLLGHRPVGGQLARRPRRGPVRPTAAGACGRGRRSRRRGPSPPTPAAPAGAGPRTSRRRRRGSSGPASTWFTVSSSWATSASLGTGSSSGTGPLDRLVGEPEVDQPVGLRQREDVRATASRAAARSAPRTASRAATPGTTRCEPREGTSRMRRRQLLRPHPRGVDHHAGAERERLALGQAHVHVARRRPRSPPRRSAPARRTPPPSGPAPPPAGRRRRAGRPRRRRRPARRARRAPAGTTSSADTRRVDGSEPRPPGTEQPHGVAQPAARRGQRGHVPAGDVGHEERQRPDQVRRGRPHEDGALAGALPRQADLAVRQVAQPAVHELRRPAAGARGEVGALQQDDGEPAARGVERDPGAGHPAAHDDDVDRGARRRRPGPRARGPADSVPGSEAVTMIAPAAAPADCSRGRRSRN